MAMTDLTEVVIIEDWGKPEYLGGARMQYCVRIGVTHDAISVAYCVDMETARALAHALADDSRQVIIDRRK